MPSVKFCVRKSKGKFIVNKNGLANIKVQVVHNHETAMIGTVWYIDPKYMSEDGWIKSSYRGHTTQNGAMLQLRDEYNDIIADIGTAIRDMPLATLVARLKSGSDNGADFCEYTRERIRQLRKEKRTSMEELYSVTLKHLKEYAGEEKILFRQISPAFLEGFEKHLKAGGASVNTIRNYMCNIRAIFNHAIDKTETIKIQLFPFRKYKISGERKQPRSIDRNDMRRLVMAQPYLTRAEQRDVDLFLLIFYTGGTNFKDLLFLKKADYYKDRIIYDRFKTSREYSIRIYPEAREIIERHAGTEYLLKYIEKKKLVTRADREAYVTKDLLKNTNKNLRRAGNACGITLRLSTYVARYSFATMAAKLDTPKDVIAHILGHGNDMTDGYIDWYQEKDDKALRKVIDYLIKIPKRKRKNPKVNL
jgi:site-specific recombinase XerD